MTADPSLPDLSIFLADYLNDAREDLQRANRALLALEKNPNEPERLNEIFRAVHTLKSSSAMLDFGSIGPERERFPRAAGVIDGAPGQVLGCVAPRVWLWPGWVMRTGRTCSSANLVGSDSHTS